MEFPNLLHNQLQQVFLIQELELLDLLQLVPLLPNAHQCGRELHEFPVLQLVMQKVREFHLE